MLYQTCGLSPVLRLRKSPTFNTSLLELGLASISLLAHESYPRPLTITNLAEEISLEFLELLSNSCGSALGSLTTLLTWTLSPPICEAKLPQKFSAETILNDEIFVLPVLIKDTTNITNAI